MSSALFQPLTIGEMTVPNRFAMAPMVTNFGDKHGMVTQRLIDYYADRARGKVGLIIVEAACIDPVGRIEAHQIGIYDDRFIPGLSRLAGAIREAGARACIQIQHGGRSARVKFNGGIQPIAPSALPQFRMRPPREMTADDIAGVIESFGQAARRARQAGFDAIELHFAHGYLVHLFLSPITNKRTDRYGGDLESRARLAVEIIRRIRREVGDGYPVIVRTCATDGIKGGLTLFEAKKVVGMLEEAGISASNVSAGYMPSYEEGYLNMQVPFSVAPMAVPRGYYIELGHEIKKVAAKPVIVVGRLDDPALAEWVVANGKADMVALGRGLIADPAFVAKVYEGRFDDIRRCTACSTCAWSMLVEESLTCACNPDVGREAEYRITPAEQSKSVVVVGGGPGGMEAARVAALRGHRVTLFEKKAFLGGNTVPAAGASFKKELQNITRYLSREVYRAGVTVFLNTEADAGVVEALNPDAVILATGSSPLLPPVPGIEGGNVVDAVRVLEGKAATGRRVVVAGAGSTGCEAAYTLAQAGKDVTIVEMRVTDFSDFDGLAADMEPLLRRSFLFDLWTQYPITVIGKSTFKEVTSEGLVVENCEGERRLIKADTVVIAAGMKPNSSLKPLLKGKVAELYEIGDAVKPRRIVDATREAARVARLI